MRYYDNFEQSHIGQFPYGWTRRLGALSEFQNTVITVEHDGTPPVKRREALWDSTDHARGFVTFDAVDGDANRDEVEILTFVKPEAFGSPYGIYKPQLIARASGLSGAENYYRAFLFFNPLNFITVAAVKAGGADGGPNINQAFTADPLKGYYIRWRISDIAGSPSAVLHQFKVWAEDEAEPSAWTATGTDFTPGALFNAPGWCGMLIGQDSTTVKVKMRVNFFSVGTAGDTAWKPRTNDEYLVALDDQDLAFRVIADMQAYGYDADGSGGREKYLLLPLSMGSPTAAPASSPDTVANSIVGDLRVVCDFLLDSYVSAGGAQTLFSKWNITGNQRSWALQISDTGIPTLFWSPDGSTTIGVKAELSGSPSVFATLALERTRLLVTLDVNNGGGGWTVQFWTSVDGGNWTQFGRTISGTGVTSIFNSTASILVGAQNADTGLCVESTIYLAQLFNGLGGPLVVDFNPERDGTAHSGTMTSALTGEVWTVRAPAYIEPLTYTALRDCRIADGGYVSQAWDDPPSTPYPALIKQVPTFSQKMDLDFSGKSVQGTVGIGSMKVINPASVTDGPGARDDWARMKWKKDNVRLSFGGWNWPKHDFRPLIVGRVGQPTAPAGADELDFPIADIMDMLSHPLQLNRYPVTAPMPGALKPLFFGGPVFMEPVPSSTTELEFQVNDGRAFIINVFDNGISLTKQVVVIAADATNDLLTLGSSSGSPSDPITGVSAGSEIYLGGNMPGGMIDGQRYYTISDGLVEAPTGTKFKVSLTVEGTPVNFINGNTGAAGTLRGWRRVDPVDTISTAETTSGKFVLAAANAGRVLVMNPGSRDGVGLEYDVTTVLEAIIFDKFGLSEDFKDTAAFAALHEAFPDHVGIALYDEPILCKDMVHRVSERTNCWYSIRPDGLLSVGHLGLPAATAVMEFNQSNTDELKLDRVIQPVNRATMSARVLHAWLHSGPVTFPIVPAVNATLLAPYWTVPTTFLFSIVAGVPLDAHQEFSGDVVDRPPFDSIFASYNSDELVRIAAFYATKVGLFSFRARRKASQLQIGQTIQMTNPRLGWKQYSPSDPPSQDNLANFDATKAVVLGKEMRPNQGDSILPMTVYCYRQLPGNYPEADL